MGKILLYLVIIFSLKFTTIQAQETEASKVIIDKIKNAENALNEGLQLDQQDLREIVCLTNIGTKKGDGNYIGIVFYPSENEIQIWKDWVEKHKLKISFSKDSEIYEREYGRKVIQVEYEKEKFRNNVCDDDKTYQNWIKQNKKN